MKLLNLFAAVTLTACVPKAAPETPTPVVEEEQHSVYARVFTTYTQVDNVVFKLELCVHGTEEIPLEDWKFHAISLDFVELTSEQVFQLTPAEPLVYDNE